MKRILLITLTCVSLALTGRAADFAAQVNDLIPKLADPAVTNRYEAQMALQDISSNSAKPGNDADRAALGSVLAGKAGDASVPQPARVWIVRQLEYMGGAEAVPALTQLLADADPELRECARRALEKNPDPQSTASLRAALQKGGDATWKIGLLRSLGQKHDADAVALIAPLLTDTQLGGPAAKALGNIASPASVAALWAAFNTQPVASEALVCAAAQLKSADIATKLYQQSKDSATRAAAISILAPSVPSDAFTSPDLRIQKASVDASAPAALTALLPTLPATAKVFALRVIDSENAVLDCVTDKEEAVRVAALETLARLGTAESVPRLIKAAQAGTDDEKTAATAALGRINGGTAGAAIEKLAAQGEPAVRVIAINALALRADKSALPALLQYAGEKDAAVSRAALQAIGKLGGDESLDALVKLVQAGKSGAKDALLKVANRSTDKSAVGQKLAGQAQNAQGAQLVAILDVMSLVGGPAALTSVVKYTTSTNDEVKDGAIRALCNWQDFAAVNPLLTVAATPGIKLVYQVLSIQAVCRLIQSETAEPVQARADAALAALHAASRQQERTQVLAALATIHDRKAADAIIKLLADPTVKTDAAHAALNLADALRKPDRNTAKRLAEAVKKANVSPQLTNKAEQFLQKR